MPHKTREQRKRWERRWRARKKNYIRAVKEGVRCADCGKHYPHYVMDFHHRRHKKFELSKCTMKSWGAIAKEMAKCDVVCANCHRERTFGRD